MQVYEQIQYYDGKEIDRGFCLLTSGHKTLGPYCNLESLCAGVRSHMNRVTPRDIPFSLTNFSNMELLFSQDHQKNDISILRRGLTSEQLEELAQIVTSCLAHTRPYLVLPRSAFT